jgi:hypothetical protein
MDSNLKRDYREIFGSDPGKRVLEDICNKAGLSSSSFVPADPLKMAFLEGRRDLALSILATINKPTQETIEHRLAKSIFIK